MKKFIMEQVGITTLGALISALGIGFFLTPHKLVTGGFGGLSLFTHYLIDLPVGLLVFLFNIPVFIAGWRTLGRSFFLGSLYGTLVFAGAIFVVEQFSSLNPLHDPLLAAIFGGLLGGIGAGLSMRVNSSLGGTDIIGALFRKSHSVSIGTVSFIVNMVIIAISGSVFGTETAAYGLISIFVGALAMDRAIQGINTSIAIFIVTEKPKDIADLIMKKLNRGVTFLEGHGAYEKTPTKVLYCVATLRELARIKFYVRSTDREAFMTIADVAEVIGHGFKPAPF